MIPGIKAGAKFTIITEIRDMNGHLKERTVEEGVTEEAEEKTPTAIAEFSIKADRNISQQLRKEIDTAEEKGMRGIRRIK